MNLFNLIIYLMWVQSAMERLHEELYFESLQVFKFFHVFAEKKSVVVATVALL